MTTRFFLAAGGVKASLRFPVGAGAVTLLGARSVFAVSSDSPRQSPSVRFLFGSAPVFITLTHTVSRRLRCGLAGRSRGTAGAWQVPLPRRS